MAKYPGSQIAFEYGTNAEIAKSYGVSERTVYRWKAKARSEIGYKASGAKKPTLKQISKFKGTRKELAAKYGISERTAYRWLAKAKEQGLDVSRKNTARYPGIGADLEGKLKDVAEKYGVSERTISRWKKRQEVEKQDLEEILSPDNIPEEFQPSAEAVEQPFAEEVTDQEYEEDISDLEENLSRETLDNLRGISDILDSEDLLVEGSIFHNLTTKEKLQYLDAYIQYQYDLDEHQFYNEAEHTMDFSPDFLSTINIWGEEFEEWAQKQFDYSIYEV